MEGQFPSSHIHVPASTDVQSEEEKRQRLHTINLNERNQPAREMETEKPPAYHSPIREHYVPPYQPTYNEQGR